MPTEEEPDPGQMHYIRPIAIEINVLLELYKGLYLEKVFSLERRDRGLKNGETSGIKKTGLCTKEGFALLCTTVQAVFGIFIL